ncbi:MAG: glycosyltransferase [Bradymonadaceae bacterium]
MCERAWSAGRSTAKFWSATATVPTGPSRSPDAPGPDQWNRAAREARGDILAFLHADALVDAGWASAIVSAIADGAVGGWFQVEIVPESTSAVDAMGLRLMAAGINARTRLWQTATSDQCLFVRRETFEAIGGVPRLPLMEGYELARRLRRAGPTAILDPHLRISGRRWERGGLVRTMCVMFLLRGAYIAGVDVDWLERIWNRV